MKYIQENLKEFEICGILKWHQKGYTGKGIKIAEIEGARPDLWIFDGKLKDPFGYGKDSPINNHGQKVLDVMHQVAPDAELYTLPSGIITSPNKVEGAFVEKTLPYAIGNGIHIIGASLGGTNHPLLNEKIREAQRYGVTFVTSAGNIGEEGLRGFAASNVWISVGAVHYSDGLNKILLANYSSRGAELDIVSFSNIYVHDGRPGYENRVFPQEGTSFAQPLVSGMLVLVQQFFLENAGRTLYQDELEKFIRDHVIDLGETGFDEEYGHGLFVLPDPDTIEMEKYLLRGGFELNRPEFIIIHHSLTRDNVVLSDFEAIRNYHVNTNGWRDIGYHWVLEKVKNQWVWKKGRDEKEEGAHCKEQGMNRKSIGICIVGNFDKDKPTDEIYNLVADKCREIMSRYPNIKPENIQPHRKYATYKSCPGKNFDMNKLITLVKQKGGDTMAGNTQKSEVIKTKYAPKLIDGVTYMQVREIIEAAGGTVNWRGNDKPIEIIINGYKLYIKIGEKQITRVKQLE